MDDNVVTLPLRRIRPSVASRVKQMAPALLPERRKDGRVLHAGAVVTVAYPSGLDPSANQMETDARRFEAVVKSQYSDSVVIDVPFRQKDGSGVREGARAWSGRGRGRVLDLRCG